MSELESLPEKVASSIPYFFYDLFGRIFPGLFLLCGLFIACRDNSLFQEFLDRAEKARTAEWVIGSVILTAACFVTGFLLSMVSRALWLFRIPVSLMDLRDQFGSLTTAESPLEVAFKANFGFSLDHKSQTRAYLAYCSRLCQLAVATRHYALDSLSVRVDAEELLSRSLCVGSVILLLVSVALHQWIPCIAYATLGTVSLFSYLHYRKKGIRERFQMFLVLWRTQTTGKTPRQP